MTTTSESVDLLKAIDLTAILHKTAEEKAKQLPTPTGYRILCAIPEQEKEFEGGIIKADETIMIEETLTTVLFVVLWDQTAIRTKAAFPADPIAMLATSF